MKVEQFKWLYFEPYVFIELKKNSLLLYNTLKGSYIELEANIEINKIVKRILFEDNLYVTRVTKKDLKNPKVFNTKYLIPSPP